MNGWKRAAAACLAAALLLGLTACGGRRSGSSGSLDWLRPSSQPESSAQPPTQSQPGADPVPEESEPLPDLDGQGGAYQPPEGEGYEVASGFMEESAVWTLYEDGTLLISGTGQVYNWYPANAPWNAYRMDVIVGVVEEGITGFGMGFFFDCENMVSASIPEGVIRLEGETFAECRSLTEVYLPASILIIAQDAFEYCGALTDVYFAGSQVDWDKLSSSSRNAIPEGATIHCTG